MHPIFVMYAPGDAFFAHILIDKLAHAGYEIVNLVVENQTASHDLDWTEANFVYIITPEALSLPICLHQMDFALSLENSPKIVPIIRLQPDTNLIFASIQDEALRTIAEHVWVQLCRLNWLFFRETDEFEASFDRLRHALDHDLEYVKRHTILDNRAGEWEKAKRPDGLLMIGAEFVTAQKWLDRSANKEPAPTDLQRAYIEASRRADEWNRRQEKERIQREEMLRQETTQKLDFEQGMRKQIRPRLILAILFGGVVLICAVVMLITQQLNPRAISAEDRAATNKAYISTSVHEKVQFYEFFEDGMATYYHEHNCLVYCRTPTPSPIGHTP